MHEQTTLDSAVSVSYYILYLLLYLWKHFASISYFYTWNFPITFGNRFFFCKFIAVCIYIFIYICQRIAYHNWVGIRNGLLHLERSFIYNIFFVCNNILFSILIRNAFLSPLLHISGNTVFFVGLTFWANVL